MMVSGELEVLVFPLCGPLLKAEVAQYMAPSFVQQLLTAEALALSDG